VTGFFSDTARGSAANSKPFTFRHAGTAKTMKRSTTTRVLMLLENNPYVRDIRVVAEASALTNAGYHVTVIAPAARGHRWHEVVDGVVTYSYPAPPALNGVLGFIWEYGYTMAASFMLSLVVFLRHGFDIIHSHNPPDLFVFIAAFYKLFGVRFVFDHHDLSAEMYCARFGARSSRLIYRVLVGLEKLSCRLADHVIATNESYMAVEVERDGVPPGRITIVRNGPDLNRTRPVEPDPGLRGLGKTVIGYVGEMGFQDGIDYLLRAIRYLAYDLHRTDFFCVLVGKGAAWDRLQALSTELGIGEHVWFPGRVSDDDLLRYLCAADICVDPDPSNPFNDRSSMIKMSEYMALAKPIVAFDLPEHRFTAQQAALYARPNDEAAFARALAELMDDPERRRVMGAFGRQRVESALAWPYSIPCLLKAYSTLTTRGKSPTPFAPSSLQRGKRELVGLRFSQWAWWRRERSLGYIARRATALAKRYGVTPPKAERRILACVRQLAAHGCHPTFAIPGGIVAKYGAFSRKLQAMGAELAIHGYQHVDFRSLTPAEASHQFIQAGAAFREQRIRAHGYRCPYLSATEELPGVIPDGLVQYSSNHAIWWDGVLGCDGGNAVFDTLGRLYRAESSQAAVATPRLLNGLVEIPVSLPDDLQLSDGLNLDPSAIQQVWMAMLHQVHRRGELFVLLFHPESYDHCAQAFEQVLREARQVRPAVWMTQLRDVSRWWREKAAFEVDLCVGQSGSLRVRFRCSDRATVLVRNLHAAHAEPWSGDYHVLNGRTLDVPGDVRPFVGVAPDVPNRAISFLQEQGYILERGDTARGCGVYLDATCVSQFETDVQLVDHIESSPAPLIRFWRWPDAYRSALCVSGDIDALTLVDYGARLFTRSGARAASGHGAARRTRRTRTGSARRLIFRIFPPAVRVLRGD
jgi:glycosyltransferase involved in cell wall biosynthesis/peptidoglycan/xylan/chitin deacetylase (PgdA/CDA1 family)